MRWTPAFSNYLGQLLLSEWQNHKAVELKVDEKEILAKIHSIIDKELDKEKQLDKEVDKMLDDLEKTHSEQFERYKMFPLLKKKLADKKGVIL